MRIEMWADIANPWTHVAAERLRVALAAADTAVGWADIANPWTHVAAERLRVALAAADTAVDTAVEVVWRPLLTDAGRARLRELLLVGKARGITISPTLADGDRLLEFAMSPATIGEFLAAGPSRRLPAEVERLRWAEELVRLSDPLGAQRRR